MKKLLQNYSEMFVAHLNIIPNHCTHVSFDKKIDNS